jgi:predicted transposase/invertase (TIGR01784 family)
MPKDTTSREQELRELYKPILTHFPDRSVRWLLEDKENVRGLIEILASELVDQMDFSRLERQSTNFLSSKLQEQVSDLIFSVPFKRGSETDVLLIYILIEHQSMVDVSMGFRLLFYITNIWDAQRQRWQQDNVPKSEWCFASNTSHRVL